MGEGRSPQALFLGPLPVERLNEALSLELDPGDVKFSSNAQKHAARRHPEDYPLCLPFLRAVVTNPLYAGDDARNVGKVELVGRVQSLGACLLVAVTVEKDGDGYYNVASFYPISERKAEDRRARGRLKRLK